MPEDCNYKDRAWSIISKDLAQLEQSIKHWLPGYNTARQAEATLADLRDELERRVNEHECEQLSKFGPWKTMAALTPSTFEGWSLQIDVTPEPKS